jgi:hypothetical protein
LQCYTSSGWTTIEDQKAVDAYTVASKARDTADSKRQVFVSTPYPPYEIGDLWVNGTDLKRCSIARTSGSYNANDWVLATAYDNTTTTINGGIVTSGTVQLAGSGGSILAGITGEGTDNAAVRFWAGASKENRAAAPFRVDQSGKLVATQVDITGKITATSGKFTGEVQATAGKIGGFNIGDNSLTNANDNASIDFSGSGGLIRAGISMANSLFVGNTAGYFINTSAGTGSFPQQYALYTKGLTTTNEGTQNYAMFIDGGVVGGLALKLKTVSSATTLTMAETIIFATSATTITLLSPASSQKGKMYFIRNRSGGNVVLSGTIYVDSQTTSATLKNHYLGILINTGTYWTYNAILF